MVITDYKNMDLVNGTIGNKGILFKGIRLNDLVPRVYKIPETMTTNLTEVLQIWSNLQCVTMSLTGKGTWECLSTHDNIND